MVMLALSCLKGVFLYEGKTVSGCITCSAVAGMTEWLSKV
ncbi:hypothetical protein HMPREF0880_00476 [Yokenella regensburgei ATCC 43003]|jgi:hypothetical protein|nr:hypothetical protein HMPREF0880_00476 [Yokenella regensburgei ATCC 43003]